MTVLNGWVSMPKVFLINSGLTAENQTNATITIEAVTHSRLNQGIKAKLALFQTEEGDYTPKNTLCRFTLVDSTTDDVVVQIEGNLGDDEDDYGTLIAAAHASDEFKVFNLIVNKTGFANTIKASRATNALNSLGRSALMTDWTYEPNSKSNVGNIYDIITTAPDTPTGIYMVLGDNLMLLTEVLRAAKKLNIPLTVELKPELSVEQAISVAQSANTHDYRVNIVWNPTLSRPNNATSLKGRLKPRFAMGTLMGRTMLRNANTNAHGIPPLHRPIAGYDYPFTWLGLTQRHDVVMSDMVRKKLAKARINTIYAEKFTAGVRFIMGDVRTQYDVKAGSPLELTNASEISMFIDRTVIELARRHLLKPQSEFLKIIISDISKFMEKCTDVNNQLIVNSDEIGGYYALTVMPRADRPNDAVDLRLAYRPEGATRAVYLNTAVYAT